MREKINEYLLGLDKEIDQCLKVIDRCLKVIEGNEWSTTDFEVIKDNCLKLQVRIETLNEVKNDLQGRLNEEIWEQEM